LAKEEDSLSESKKQWMKSELTRLGDEKKKNCLPTDALITVEHLSNLKLGPKQLAKLGTQQHPSPVKYSDAKLNLISTQRLDEAHQQQAKVKQLQERVMKFA
jgi:hypothetical protein